MPDSALHAVGTAPSTPAAVRTTTVVAVSTVAAVAAAVSFMHMHALAARAGEGWRAWLVPMAVDGLVVAASMSMLVRRRAGKRAGWLAWTSMTAGITASLAANVAAAEPTLIGRAVAAWPPLALLMAYELLMDQVRTGTTHSTDHPGRHVTSTTPEPATVQADVQPTTPPATAAVAVTSPTVVPRPPAAHPDDTRTPPPGASGNPAGTGAALRPAVLPRVANLVVPTEPTVPPTRHSETADATRNAARHFYLQRLADGTPCKGKELADRFGMSERWGRYQIRAAGRQLATATTQPSTP